MVRPASSPLRSNRVTGRSSQRGTGPPSRAGSASSTVKVDGKNVTTYHYVMTQDFPYSVSCFRATPVSLGP